MQRQAIQWTCLLFSLLLCSLWNASAQKTTRARAIKENDYGVVYTLPKTSFVITFLIKKSTYKKGDFYPYAQPYLGVDHPVTEDHTEFVLEKMWVENCGISDKSNSYMVAFRPKTFEPFVTLREDGVILAVNSDAELMETEEITIPEGELPADNPRRYFSQETIMAGSTAKKAETVARQIFDLRRNRSDILSGEADNMPPDGNAYKVVMDEIDRQEKALTELFAGSIRTEYFTATYTVVPDEKDIERKVIARFSGKLGALDADNLAGEPIYFSLKNSSQENESALTEKELKKQEKKLSEGLVFNLPGKANLTLEYQNRVQINKEVDVVQYGSQDVLVKKMFENLKQPVKVFFHPHLGAIKQIIQ